MYGTLVREKKKGTTSRVIADTPKVSTRQVQRLWNRFEHLDIGEMLYAKTSGKTPEQQSQTQGTLRSLLHLARSSMAHLPSTGRSRMQEITYQKTAYTKCCQRMLGMSRLSVISFFRPYRQDNLTTN